MNNSKRVLTFALAVCSLSAFASCGSSSDSSSKVVDKKLKEDQQQIVQRLSDDMTDVRDLKSNEIKWFSHWDINPTEAEDKEIGADLALFKTKYNGKINWVQTTWETKFDDLAALVMSNDSPDFIGADDMDVFPKGAIKSMIEPIDDYIDLSKPLWTDIKGATDKFMLGDKHYVSVIRTDPAYVFVYNKRTMEDNAYDDPAELFKEGKWNWDTFTEMCLDFTDAESDKYALDGWYYEKALQQSSGVPLIGITDGKLVNNISDPMIAKAQNMMYELQKNNVVYPKHENNWKLRGDAEGSGMATGLTLFYPIGLWALENAPSTTVNYGDVSKGEVMFVPVPCSADSDKQYIPSRVHGFSIVRNAQNPEGVAAFLECCRYAELDEAAHQITLDQYKDDYGWTDEMLEMRETIYELSAQNPVFDFEQGVSADLNSICDTAIRGTMNPQESKSWSQVVQENEKAIDYIIGEVMTSMNEAK